MPRKGEIDPNKHVNKDVGRTYQSRIDRSREYDKKDVDKIIVRVPKGARDKLNAYIEEKASADPDNAKYSDVVRKRPSLNALIKYLLTEETGIKL